jgi:hypothetical protein
MYQKDFILRMIEMIAELIAGILGLIKKGDFQQASQAIDNAYYDFLKQDASFFRSIKKEKLTDDLIELHNYTNGHLEILSELFYAEAELLYAEGKCLESIEYYDKTLILYEFIDKATNSYSLEKQSKISFIKKRVAQIEETES